MTRIVSTASDRYMAAFIDDDRPDEELIEEARRRARRAGRFEGKAVLVAHQMPRASGCHVGNIVIVHVDTPVTAGRVDRSTAVTAK